MVHTFHLSVMGRGIWCHEKLVGSPWCKPFCYGTAHTMIFAWVQSLCPLLLTLRSWYWLGVECLTSKVQPNNLDSWLMYKSYWLIGNGTLYNSVEYPTCINTAPLNAWEISLNFTPLYLSYLRTAVSIVLVGQGKALHYPVWSCPKIVMLRANITFDQRLALIIQQSST